MAGPEDEQKKPIMQPLKLAEMPDANQKAVAAFTVDLNKQAAELQRVLPEFEATVEDNPLEIAERAGQMDQVKTAVKTIELLNLQLQEQGLSEDTAAAIKEQRKALEEARDAWPGDIKKLVPDQGGGLAASLISSASQIYGWVSSSLQSLWQYATAIISRG